MGNRMVQALVLAVTAVAAAGAGSAAGTRAQASPDVLGALLVEVRGLRAAMEQMASAGPRVQLALGRLQLQEQRVITLLRQNADVRDRLATAEHESTDLGHKIEAGQVALQDVGMEV